MVVNSKAGLYKPRKMTSINFENSKKSVQIGLIQQPLQTGVRSSHHNLTLFVKYQKTVQSRSSSSGNGEDTKNVITDFQVIYGWEFDRVIFFY